MNTKEEQTEAELLALTRLFEINNTIKSEVRNIGE